MNELATRPDFRCDISRENNGLFTLMAAAKPRQFSNKNEIVRAAVVLVEDLQVASSWTEVNNRLDVPESVLLDEWYQGQIAIALISVFTDQDNDRLVATVSAATDKDFRGRGYGGHVLETAVMNTPNLITEMIHDCPSLLTIFLDDVSDPPGWTSYMAEKLGFTYQGRVCDIKTFSKEVSLNHT